MQTQINKSPDFLLPIAGIFVILLGVTGFMGCNPSSTDTNATRGTSAKNSSNSAPARCVNCGQIELVREIVTRGQGSGLGAVGGAVVGGAVGNQVGAGRGRDLATVAGAVGGAVAGNEIEKRSKSTKSYEITVRLNDGSSRVVSETNPPMWRPGDRVKINNGMIQSN